MRLQIFSNSRPFELAVKLKLNNQNKVNGLSALKLNAQKCKRFNNGCVVI